MITINLTKKEITDLYKLLYNSYDNQSLRKKVTEAYNNFTILEKRKCSTLKDNPLLKNKLL